MKLFRYLTIVILICTRLNCFSQDTDITLGINSNLLNYAGVPIFQWFPDGHISILKEYNSDQYAMYWAGHESYRTVGENQFPEFQLTLAPENKILGEKFDADAWDNGGSWLMSVFRVSEDTLIGFYHAEDHYFGSVNPGNIAWKSLARVISYDNGFTWLQPEQIITSENMKPQNPEWGGSGDNSIIWDKVNNRWLCYFQEQDIMIAMSQDRLGRPGTWYKYHNGSFSEPGLGGQSSKANGLIISGGNPSVHFNYYLNKYVIIYHSWNRHIYLSTSQNGIDWEYPTKIINAPLSRRAWYPTIIGDTDLSAGKIARLYYADMGSNSRNFVSRAIIFEDTGTFKPNDWEYEKIGRFTLNGSFDSLVSSWYRIISFEGTIDENPIYGYHYKELKDSSEYTFSLKIDNEMPGSVGMAIRAGLDDTDEEIILSYDGSKLSYKHGLQVIDDILRDEMSIQVRNVNDTLSISYQNDDSTWVLIQNINWIRSSSYIGFFSLGTPKNPTISYVSELIIEPYVPKKLEEPEEEEEPINKELLVYPNPVKDTLIIDFAESLDRITLMDLNGKILIDTRYKNKLNIKDLSNGIYILKIIKLDGQYENHRIMIKN